VLQHERSQKAMLLQEGGKRAAVCTAAVLLLRPHYCCLHRPLLAVLLLQHLPAPSMLLSDL
jgi:hypothetical protein